MKKNKRDVGLKGISTDFLKMCPACGYTFRTFEKRSQEKVEKCPMCGYKFIEPNVLPQKPNDFNKKYI